MRNTIKKPHHGVRPRILFGDLFGLGRLPMLFEVAANHYHNREGGQDGIENLFAPGHVGFVIGHDLNNHDKDTDGVHGGDGAPEGMFFH